MKTWIEETWPDGFIDGDELGADYIVKEVLSKFRDEVAKRCDQTVRRNFQSHPKFTTAEAMNDIFREIGL